MGQHSSLVLCAREPVATPFVRFLGSGFGDRDRREAAVEGGNKLSRRASNETELMKEAERREARSHPDAGERSDLRGRAQSDQGRWKKPLSTKIWNKT